MPWDATRNPKQLGRVIANSQNECAILCCPSNCNNRPAGFAGTPQRQAICAAHVVGPAFVRHLQRKGACVANERTPVRCTWGLNCGFLRITATCALYIGWKSAASGHVRHAPGTVILPCAIRTRLRRCETPASYVGLCNNTLSLVGLTGSALFLCGCASGFVSGFVSAAAPQQATPNRKSRLFVQFVGKWF